MSEGTYENSPDTQRQLIPTEDLVDTQIKNNRHKNMHPELFKDKVKKALLTKKKSNSNNKIIAKPKKVFKQVLPFKNKQQRDIEYSKDEEENKEKDTGKLLDYIEVEKPE